ncbi:CBS domain-containing protein [Synechococcus elongatus]|uniref:CBS domain-containing protein n=1 Tax=Synechococcus elongatus PCC 11802 TaxID=2283154 RepID=A0AAU6R567_SYNEL
MDLILCHGTADFDTLGAAVGLSRLLPGSRIVLTGGAHPAVRDFLALYRDEYPLIERRAVDPQRLRRIHLVDAQERLRFGKAAEWLDLPQLEAIAVYDHHLQSPCDITASDRQVEAIGATATLICERLQAAQIQLAPAEATVLALGIHVDTGSLSYDQSTPRDAQALAWLMTQGANLRVLREYVEPGLSAPLQALLSQSLEVLELEERRGKTLAQVLLPVDGYLTGLSSLAAQLFALTEADLLLLGVHYPVEGSTDRRLTVIGRSRIEGPDLGQTFRQWGGGGHARAASLNWRGTAIAETWEAIGAAVLEQLPAPLLARDLMSSPVRTVRPEIAIAEAERILLRYGHSGLSVVDEQDQLVGIISRRDLDLALHHGFGHAPVKGYMTLNPKTITPETSLPEIEDLMVTYDIGRLPVLDRDQLVGIVTRTDVLRQLHQDQQRQTPPLNAPACLLPGTPRDWLRQRLIPAQWELLETAAHFAEERGWHLYLVGGGVRDLFLAQTDAPLLISDIDLVVDGFHRALTEAAGVELAQLLRDRYPQARLEVHGRFQTAALLWHDDPVFQSLWVDIATARTEFYPYPAANPEVEASSIRQDLYRRDFTINALAIRLTEPHAGELLDFFGGRLDLEARQVRVLHVNSFIEDPTRIFRAVRFAVRLSFAIEDQTRRQIRYALDSGVYQRTQGENSVTPALQTRLRAELQLIVEARYWLPALRELGSLQAFRCLHSDCWWTRSLEAQLRRCDRLSQRWQQQAHPSLKPVPPWLLRLQSLLTSLPEPGPIAQRLQLPQEVIQRLQQWPEAIAQLTQLDSAQLPSQLYRQLADYDPITLLLATAVLPRSQRRVISRYLWEWLPLELPISGHDLKTLGYRPGPQFREILEALHGAVLDGKVPAGSDEAARQRVLHWLSDRYPHP